MKRNNSGGAHLLALAHVARGEHWRREETRRLQLAALAEQAANPSMQELLQRVIRAAKDHDADADRAARDELIRRYGLRLPSM